MEVMLASLLPTKSAQPTVHSSWWTATGHSFRMNALRGGRAWKWRERATDSVDSTPWA